VPAVCGTNAGGGPASLGLGTALGFGLDAADLETKITPFTLDDLYAPDDPAAARFLSLLNSWIEMIMVINELARSMGQPDFYPFVMSKPVVAKLQLVQMIMLDASSFAQQRRLEDTGNNEESA